MQMGIELGKLLVRSGQFNKSHLGTLTRLVLVSLAGVPAVDNLRNLLRAWQGKRRQPFNGP